MNTPLQKDRQPWWTVCTGEYATEASNLAAKTNLTRCPHCGKADQIHLNPSYNGEGELTYWSGRHYCGAKLTIFND